MVQEINEVGTIEVLATKNVVFKKREIKDIIMTVERGCAIVVDKTADEGRLSETVIIPQETFAELLEPEIWSAVDKINRKDDDNGN